ncbi:MAG: hypothetical protein R2795_16195 [Saprospiraceae bacterium]
MNALLGLGKYLFAIPFAIFGLFHFMGADGMAGMVPVPGGVVWVYLTGIGLLAATVAILIGKMDKLATFLLGIMMLSFALLIHFKGFMSQDPAASASFLKDIALAGASWLYAGHLSKDKAVIG